MNFGVPIIMLIIFSIFYHTYTVKNKGLLRLNEELKFQTAYLEKLFENFQDGILILDNKDRIINANRSFQKILQYKSDELKGLHVNDIITCPETKDVFEISQIAIHRGTTSSETKLRRRDGKLIEVKVDAFPLILDTNRVGLCAIYKDIAHKKDSEKALELQKNYFDQLFENSPEAVCIIDTEDRFIDINSAFEKLFGFTKDELINYHVNNRIVQAESMEEAMQISENYMKGNTIEHETVRMRKDGSLVDVFILGYPIIFENKQVGVFGIYRDITERKRLEQKLEYLSYHDELTGLYNRRFFEEELRRLDVERNLPLTIAMADVNGLKLMNDSFGHSIGDELLKKVAGVFTRGCRADDIIARLGGDEFVILLPRTDNDEAEQIAKRIKAIALQEKLGSFDISISLGWQTKKIREEQIQEIFKKAEDHMYKKKLFESPNMRGKTVSAIISTLHEKNKREEQHSHRVSALCQSIGQTIGLPEEEIEELKTVGLLHDIGKIAIDEKILNKPRKLSASEWEEIKRHPEIGYRILSTVNDMSEMAKFVLAHHERWDGKGYPKGLKKDQIPLQSRIITIADAYDAMTSERSYRCALPKEIAIQELQENAGSQFDPELVRVFIGKVLNIPMG